MKDKISMLELCVNLMVFAIALALVIQIMMKTTLINYHNTIKAKAIIQLNSIVAILQEHQGDLEGYYQTSDSLILFDSNNINTTDDYYYCVKVENNFPIFHLDVYDKYDNLIIETDYEVAYED